MDPLLQDGITDPLSGPAPDAGVRAGGPACLSGSLLVGAGAVTLAAVVTPPIPIRPATRRC